MEDRQLAGLIMFLIAFFGFTVNVAVVFAVPHVSFLSKSFFGRVARIQVFSGACHCALFAFVTAPIIFFSTAVTCAEGLSNCNITFVERRNVTVYLAFSLEFFYEISSYGHVLLASNRFIVLFFRLGQSSLHVPSWMKIIGIAFPLVVSECVLVVTYTIEGCDYYLDTTAWGFIFDEEERCVEFRLYTSFSRYAIMLIIVAILDVACVVKVRHVQKSRTTAASNAKSSVEHRLLYQACAQASLFLADILSAFVILPHLSNDQWAQFFLATVVWVAAMGADGLMMFIFNREIRHVVFRNSRCKIFERSRAGTLSSTIFTRSRNDPS